MQSFVTSKTTRKPQPEGAVLTILRLWGAVVGLVDGMPEAHVAATAAYHRTSRPVEGNAALIGFLHGCLQTLQRAGLL